MLIANVKCAHCRAAVKVTPVKATATIIGSGYHGPYQPETVEVHTWVNVDHATGGLIWTCPICEERAYIDEWELVDPDMPSRTFSY